MFMYNIQCGISCIVYCLNVWGMGLLVVSVCSDCVFVNVFHQCVTYDVFVGRCEHQQVSDDAG